MWHGRDRQGFFTRCPHPLHPNWFHSTPWGSNTESQSSTSTKMRKSLFLLITLLLSILGGLVYLFSTFIALLFETGLLNAIPPETLPFRAQWTEDKHPIPKILHQTWKNETIPEMWAIAQYTCRDLHPDYEYIVFLKLPG